jgi:hypothetical protein
MSASDFKRQEVETNSASSNTTKRTNVHPVSNKKVQLTMDERMIKFGDDNLSYRSSDRKMKKYCSKNYMDETVASISRKKTTEELLSKLHEKETFNSAGSVSSWDTRSIRSGSINSGISRNSRKSIISNSNASRRLTVSASAYSETRKQKLALVQNIEAAAAVADSNGQNDSYSYHSESHRKRRKNKNHGFLHYRDPDCCVKVAVRVAPEPDDIPKCIEVKRISSSWDEDSDPDDNDYFYNGIRIFDHVDESKKEKEFQFDHVFDHTADNEEGK